MKKFIRNRPFSVLDTDMNVGTVLLPTTIVDKLASEALSDTNFYKELDKDPLQEVMNSISVTLSSLKTEGDISGKLFNAIKPDTNAKIGTFRILVKLHKKKLGIRQIINCIGHPTEKISLLIDIYYSNQ